jgi:hypothetical protein
MKRPGAEPLGKCHSPLAISHWRTVDRRLWTVRLWIEDHEVLPLVDFMAGCRL